MSPEMASHSDACSSVKHRPGSPRAKTCVTRFVNMGVLYIQCVRSCWCGCMPHGGGTKNKHKDDSSRPTFLTYGSKCCFVITWRVVIGVNVNMGLVLYIYKARTWLLPCRNQGPRDILRTKFSRICLQPTIFTTYHTSYLLFIYDMCCKSWKPGLWPVYGPVTPYEIYCCNIDT